jgi:adenylosuccinate synthase
LPNFETAIALGEETPAKDTLKNRQEDFRLAELEELLHPETWQENRPRGRVHLIVGLGHGDEGKGKIAQYVGQFCDFGMRTQGGKNAGHTVYLRFDEFNVVRSEGDDKEGKEINTHQIPTTAVFEHTKNFIGPDVWLDVNAIDNEKAYLEAEGFDISPDKLGISNLCSLVLPHHIYEDELKEKGKEKLGSTKSGIAFVARDEALHKDIRANVMLQGNGKDILYKAAFEGLRAQGVNVMKALNQAHIFAENAMKFKPYIREVVSEVRGLLDDNKTGVVEGAQGAGLDRRLGKHENVTSSGTTAPALLKGGGLSQKDEGLTIGVAKAFPSKVGGGEFPERIEDKETLEILAGEKGAVDEERGKTTGREREIGWLSIPVLKK